MAAPGAVDRTECAQRCAAGCVAVVPVRGRHRELAGQGTVGPKQVGIALFGPYLLVVELASLLLLAALVAAYHLGRREDRR